MDVCKDFQERERSILPVSGSADLHRVTGSVALIMEMQEVFSEVTVHCQGGLLNSNDKPPPILHVLL